MPNTLSALGIIHTAISVIALIGGFAALIRYKEFTLNNLSGQTYLVGTLLTALTAFGIFHHGGWGPPHTLAVLTIVALAVGYIASRGGFGKRSHAVQLAAYSLTFVFQLIPGFTETLTRLPIGGPIMKSADEPFLKAVPPVLFLIYLIGFFLQIRYFRKSSVSMA
ncbi:MAG TPA: hypothetical protein VH083_02590 [Myxococcales bacterium]|jgi:uncharacterized membrane protein|nr:hypothetical protein [Myxococcales bacterium]